MLKSKIRKLEKKADSNERKVSSVDHSIASYVYGTSPIVNTELITNGGFASDLSSWTGLDSSGAGWIPSTGWSWVAGEAVFVCPAGMSYSLFYQDFPALTFSDGRTFQLSFKLSGISFATSIVFVIPSFSTTTENITTLGTPRTTNGTYVENITIPTGLGILIFGFYILLLTPGDTFHLDNVSMKEVFPTSNITGDVFIIEDTWKLSKDDDGNLIVQCYTGGVWQNRFKFHT